MQETPGFTDKIEPIIATGSAVGLGITFGKFQDSQESIPFSLCEIGINFAAPILACNSKRVLIYLVKCSCNQLTFYQHHKSMC